jgi:hypothetical protein
MFRISMTARTTNQTKLARIPIKVDRLRRTAIHVCPFKKGKNWENRFLRLKQHDFPKLTHLPGLVAQIPGAQDPHTR